MSKQCFVEAKPDQNKGHRFFTFDMFSIFVIIMIITLILLNLYLIVELYLLKHKQYDGIQIDRNLLDALVETG